MMFSLVVSVYWRVCHVRADANPTLFWKKSSRMSGSSCTVFFFIVSMLWGTPHVKADTETFCIFMKSCILPCSFQGSSDVLIHWFQLAAGKPLVHSYYDNSDHLGNQNQNFRGRTSLFKDLISRGNASLLLTGVKVEDQSRYKCHCSAVSGNKETFILLIVDAPVSKVSISQVENRIICSSEGIYPQPELAWSTIPPSNTTLQNRTTVQQTEEQLYSISSSLMVSDDNPDLIYSCTISTRRNNRRATLRQLSVISSSGQTSLSCSDPNISVTNLLWKFNHNQIIVNQTSQNREMVSEEWKHHVKDISESGTLSLQGLSSQQEGLYTCELSNEEETYITSTFLKIEDDQGGTKHIRGVLIFVGGAAVAAMVAVVLYIRCKKSKALQDISYQEAMQ